MTVNPITLDPNIIAIDQTVSIANKPKVLTNIYNDSYNMVIWQRSLSTNFQRAIDSFIKSNTTLQFDKQVSPQNILSEMYQALNGYNCMLELSEDIAELVDIFCHLFDLTHARLSLITLDRTMCPRFHVDRVPCRLITSYAGNATEWLPNSTVDRTKLGTGNKGLPDELSGIYQSTKDIQRLNNGDVALMKGNIWEGNEKNGLVHRSPPVKSGETRLLLTLDFVS